MKWLLSPLCVCVCVIGHRFVECVWIKRWWSSNLGQLPLQNCGSVAYCYIDILDPPRPILPPFNVLPGGRHLPPIPTLPPRTSKFYPNSIIRPPGHYLYPSQHTYTPVPLPHPLLPLTPAPTLPRPHHAFHITSTAATLNHPKYLLTRPSDVSLLRPVSTRAPRPPPYLVTCLPCVYLRR